MSFVHKPLLLWLLYLVTVLFIAAGLLTVGLPQMALAADHSHLTAVLAVMYLVAEAIAGRQAVLLSAEHRMTLGAQRWLETYGLLYVQTGSVLGGTTLYNVDNARLRVPRSALGTHVQALTAKTANGVRRPIDQRLLLEASTEPLYARAELADFIATRIVWVGILATIVGVIMAFWPLMHAGLDATAMQTQLPVFFGGVATAFLPTAASFVFKIALDFNSHILRTAVDEIVAAIAILSETHLLPALETKPLTLQAPTA